MRACTALLALVLVAGAGTAGCSGGSGSGDAASTATALPTIPPSTTTAPIAPTTTVPVAPTTTVPAVFSGSIEPVTVADLGASWREGCPVGPENLRMLTLSYWGFDDQPHTGALVVHADVAQSIVDVFKRLYDARFPIRSMQPVDKFGASDNASMDADNTSGFNCRLAVTSGPASWSVHAFGKAIDVNPVENPYLESGRVLPPAGSAYVNRNDVRPGMAVPGGVLMDAFASAGWLWGGRAGGFSDYQHFSVNGS